VHKLALGRRRLSQYLFSGGIGADSGARRAATVPARFAAAANGSRACSTRKGGRVWPGSVTRRDRAGD